MKPGSVLINKSKSQSIAQPSDGYMFGDHSGREIYIGMEQTQDSHINYNQQHGHINYNQQHGVRASALSIAKVLSLDNHPHPLAPSSAQFLVRVLASFLYHRTYVSQKSSHSRMQGCKESTTPPPECLLGPNRRWWVHCNEELKGIVLT